jgi:hypothetical protein
VPIDRVHARFPAAYDTKTFRRPQFSREDRRVTWQFHAAREIEEVWGAGERVDEEIIEELRTFRGDNLRHIVPCSDIAGVMYVACDAAEDEYVVRAREFVIELCRLLLGSAARWEVLCAYERNLLMKDPATRLEIAALYRQLACAPNNLFHSDSDLNQAIGNRPDPSVDARGLYGEGHVVSLIHWWYYMSAALALNPGWARQRVITVGEAILVLEHKFSRPVIPRDPRLRHKYEEYKWLHDADDVIPRFAEAA